MAVAVAADGPGARAFEKMRALRKSKLKLTERALCWAVVLRENGRTGVAAAALGLLADDAGLGLRTAERDLARLVRLGIVKRWRRRYAPSALSVSFEALRRGIQNPHVVRSLESEPARGAVQSPHGWRANSHKKLLKTEEEEASGAPSRFAFQGLHLQVTERQESLLADAFPWVDRQQEYRRADSWLEANPSRRPKRISRFMHNWLSRIDPPRREAEARGAAAVGKGPAASDSRLSSETVCILQHKADAERITALLSQLKRSWATGTRDRIETALRETGARWLTFEARQLKEAHREKSLRAELRARAATVGLTPDASMVDEIIHAVGVAEAE